MRVFRVCLNTCSLLIEDMMYVWVQGGNLGVEMTYMLLAEEELQ